MKESLETSIFFVGGKKTAGKTLLHIMIFWGCLFANTQTTHADMAREEMERYREDSQSMRKLLSPSKGLWHLYLEASFNLPFEMGARLTVQMPGGLRLAASYGLVQQAYVQEINKALMASDTYGAHTGRIVENFMRNFSVWRIHMEWRPFEKHGFYVGLSYAQLHLQGQVGAAEMADVSTGFQAAPEFLQATSYKVDAKLSLAIAEIGWEWSILYIFNLRVGVGVAKLIGHEINISTQFRTEVPMEYKQQAQQKAGRAGEIVHLILQQYNVYPSLSLGLGVRFF